MMIGHQLGAIEIRRRLGKGGVGEVYLGFDTHLDRNVAIKALRPEFAHDPAFVKRFVGEAQHLARLNHPNITTLYSLHNDGRELCMVMEYIDGQTLDEIAASCRLDEAEALAIASQTMEGLAYAHAMGVVHRDIKPANLMINRAGTLKIMDFGIARLQGSERMTRQGAIIGSIAYMAPEQILGQEGDERSDVYSLAVVLYELLCAVPPFSGDSEYALMKAQIEAQPPRLLEHLPDIRPEVEAAVLRALAKAPKERFPTVGVFREALGPTAVNPIDAAKMLKGRLAAPAITPKEASSVGSGARLPEPLVRVDPPRKQHDRRPAGKPAEERPSPEPVRRGLGDLWPRLALGGALLFSVGTLAAIALDLGQPSKRPPPPEEGPAANAPSASVRSDAVIPSAYTPPAEVEPDPASTSGTGDKSSGSTTAPAVVHREDREDPGAAGAGFPPPEDRVRVDPSPVTGEQDANPQHEVPPPGIDNAPELAKEQRGKAGSVRDEAKGGAPGGWIVHD